MKNDFKGSITGLYKLRIADIVVISMILLGSIFFIAANHNKPGGETAKVMSNGVMLCQLPLDKSGFTEVTGAEGKMMLEVKDGSIRVAGSTCPRGFCKHTGRIRSGGESIVCVPNKITIEIKGNPGTDVDGVTY